jgi:hypothetical protein
MSSVRIEYEFSTDSDEFKFTLLLASLLVQLMASVDQGQSDVIPCSSPNVIL